MDDEITSHKSFERLVESIKKIAQDYPCDDCKELKDQLNAAKSQLKTSETRYEALKEALKSSELFVLCECGDAIHEFGNVEMCGYPLCECKESKPSRVLKKEKV